MRKRNWIVTLAMLAAIPAQAQTAWPDLRGTWKGQSESIITGTGSAHHSGQAQDKPRLSSIPFTLTIDEQNGRRFSGTLSSPRAAESIIGVITHSGSLLFAETKGYDFGTLLGPDRMEACYLQIETYGRIASCTDFTKQP